jgi:transaldolase
MKIFLDTANVETIKKWVDTGLIDGVTTNPTLLAKEGSSPENILRNICSIVQGPVSIEVTEKEPEKIYKQACDIAKFSQNVVVKIPCVQEYLTVINRLVKNNIKLNITLIFSTTQALIAEKLGVTYISPFLGRWDDIGSDGIEIIEEIVTLKSNYLNFTSEIIAASVRSVIHFKKIALAGADIITVPSTVLEQAIKHPLTDKGIILFDNDWNKLGITKFF